MKNIYAILVITLLGISGNVSAQSIPNSGFESWIFFGGWYENPEFWQTNNNQIMAAFVEKDTLSFAGNYAMRVNTQGYARCHFPFLWHPTALSANVKTTIAVGDTVKIQTLVYSGNVVVDSGIWYGTASMPNWSFIIIPVSQNSNQADSLEILVSGGQAQTTRLSVDDIYCLIAGTPDMPQGSSDVVISPNPFSETTTLFTNFPLKQSAVIIMNAQGQIIRRIAPINGNRITIYRDGLADGIYILMIKDSHGNTIATGKLMVGSD